MVKTNAQTAGVSWVAKGREHLEQGQVALAVECYEKVFDPEALDETEARTMLIEGRAHLSRKHIHEALDCFEEALVMGTDVQRRQALDGIATVGEIRSGLRSLTTSLKKGLKDRLGKRQIASGLSLVSDDDNIVLISREALERLPSHLAKASKISRLPQHLVDLPLPFETDKCIPFADQGDLQYILEIASSLSAPQEPKQGSSNAGHATDAEPAVAE
jgi:tetratricopeptide (TPR) repeat protein